MAPGQEGHLSHPRMTCLPPQLNSVFANSTSSFGVRDCCEPLRSLSVSNESHFLPANYQCNRL